jgi:hypothetical protein
MRRHIALCVTPARMLSRTRLIESSNSLPPCLASCDYDGDWVQRRIQWDELEVLPSTESYEIDVTQVVLVAVAI